MPSRVLIIQHVECEAPGLAEAPLRSQGARLSFVGGHRGGPVPADPRPWDGILVLGGPMNADETLRYPFLAAERMLLEKALAENTPVLGICLGAQILARALGAPVYKARRPEVGFCRVDFEPAARSDALFGTFPNYLEVFQWHGDTFDLPRGAEHLASSGVCPNQAFRAGQAWALQFHLEVTQPIARSWMAAYGGVPLHGIARFNPRLRQEVAQPARFSQMASAAGPLFEAWAARIAARAAQAGHS